MSALRQRKQSSSPAPPSTTTRADAGAGNTVQKGKKNHVPSWKDWLPILALAGVAAMVLAGRAQV
jgi:hypothetical protein